MWTFYQRFRHDEPPPAVRLYALEGSAQAIRASQAAAAASGEQVFGDRLTWITPKPGAAQWLEGSVELTLVPVDHLPPAGDAAGCVVEHDGARIVYSGDSRPCDTLSEAARGADLLIHEVGGLDARARLLHQVGHSTAADAGRTAARAGVRALALFHVPAPEWVSPADMLAEARRHAGRRGLSQRGRNDAGRLSLATGHQFVETSHIVTAGDRDGPSIGTSPSETGEITAVANGIRMSPEQLRNEYAG